MIRSILEVLNLVDIVSLYCNLYTFFYILIYNIIYIESSIPVTTAKDNGIGKIK